MTAARPDVDVRDGKPCRSGWGGGGKLACLTVRGVVDEPGLVSDRLFYAGQLADCQGHRLASVCCCSEADGRHGEVACGQILVDVAGAGYRRRKWERGCCRRHDCVTWDGWLPGTKGKEVLVSIRAAGYTGSLHRCQPAERANGPNLYTKVGARGWQLRHAASVQLA